jgi:hypothetical protein
MSTRKLHLKATVLALALILVGSASPTSARNYYVVKNIKSLKCYVLPKKPKAKTVVLVNGGTIYRTRSDARAAVDTLAGCKT